MPGLKGQLNLPTLKYDIATDGVQDKRHPAQVQSFVLGAATQSTGTGYVRPHYQAAPGAQPLTVRLPCKVDVARVAAKFKKKLQKLVLTMPLI